MHSAIAVLAAAAAAVSAAGDKEGLEGMDHAAFEVSRLRCVIGNNAAKGEHREWYNGIFGMWSPDQEVTPYVPSYAGFNLEHYFDARPRHEYRRIFFEPRSAPMRFERINATTAELHQPESPYYGVESWTRFELKAPYYVDTAFRCVAHKPLEGGFLGCFWASYINAPLNKSMYFLRGGSTLDEPQWVQYCTLEHDRDSTVLAENDNAALQFHEGPPSLHTCISPLRYGVPFFYGRVSNMVLIYIFERGPNIRFSHSPSGGGRTSKRDDTNPAWDFQFIVPNVELDKEYGFRCRVVYKPWVDRDDVLAEVRRFLDNL